MSGYPCSECGRNVTDDICPHCGTHQQLDELAARREPSKEQALAAVAAARELLANARRKEKR